MQSWWMRFTPAGSELEQRESPAPQPGAGQLLVRLEAASLNRGEFVASHGQSGKPGEWKPVGGEGAGEVVAIGPDVQGFHPGDRVMGRCAGAFAQLALMEAAEAMAVPPSLSWEAAAALPLTFLVAFDMLVLQGRLRAGEWLLVNGVSSGVGLASLQLGKALGARVIGTSGSQEKLARLEAFGLDVAIRTREADFAARVMDATGGRGADIAFNTVGSPWFQAALDSLAIGGTQVLISTIERSVPFDILPFYRRNLQLIGVDSLKLGAAACARILDELAPGFADGSLRAFEVPGALLALDEAPDAFRRVLAGARDRVVLAP